MESVTCANGSVVPYSRVVARPVASGGYRARFAVFSSRPMQCSATGDCEPPVPTSQLSLPLAELCSSDTAADVTFLLAAGADLTVNVTIP